MTSYPVWGLWLLTWETPESWCHVFQCEAESGRRKSGMHCYPLLSEEVFGKCCSCREWWLCPTTCSHKPPLYCGWKKLNTFSQALNFVVRPLLLNNIPYFLPSHCFLLILFCFIWLTFIWPQVYLLTLNGQQQILGLASYMTSSPFHFKVPVQPVSAQLILLNFSTLKNFSYNMVALVPFTIYIQIFSYSFKTKQKLFIQ